MLVEHTVALLERLELMEAEIHSSLHEVGGTVRLAVFQSAALGIIPQALSVIERDHPQLRIEMTQREPESALFETWTREFDLVIAEQYPGHAAPRHPDLDMIPLYADELSLAVPAGSGISSLAEAASSSSWVMEPRGTASRHWAEQQCRRAGIEPDVRFETADLQAHIRLVESGHATAILPGLVWGSRTPSVELRPMPGLPRRTVFTSVRDSSVSRPSIVACREVLEEVVLSLAPE
jgi:DNA-binding transcriptional LysR family regulator